jgi:germination protein M
MRKRILAFCLALTLILSFGACEKKTVTPVSDGFVVYFFNNDGLGLQAVPYKLKEKNKTSQTEELLELLSKSTVDVDYRNPISDGLLVENYQFSEDTLVLYFNKEYESLSEMNQALLRAAVVKTLVQVEGISAVEFYVGDEPLKDEEERLVGPMTGDSFLFDYGREQSQDETAKVKLYYATEDGNYLSEISLNVHYSSNVPLEQVVLNYLSDNPKQEGIKSPIPEGTKVLSVVINEGTCYVTLDSGFLNLPEWESREVAIYSIVNTLCELENISKVQLIVSTEKDVSLVGKDEVSGTYSPDYELVETE